MNNFKINYEWNLNSLLYNVGYVSDKVIFPGGKTPELVKVDPLKKSRVKNSNSCTTWSYNITFFNDMYLAF